MGAGACISVLGVGLDAFEDEVEDDLVGFLDVFGFVGADDEGMVAEVCARAAGLAEESDGRDFHRAGAFEGDADVGGVAGG